MRKFLSLSLLLCGLLSGSSLLAIDRSVQYRLVENGSIAVVNVPPGVNQLAWQRYDAKKRVWVDSSLLKVSAPLKGYRISPPADLRGNRWRLVSRKSLESTQSAGSKFPAAFLQGARAFAPREDENGESAPDPGNPVFLASAGSGAVADTTSAQAADSSQKSSGAGVVPDESDIWKVEGNTIYYFNELRGLQVIDASDPSDPVVTSALRLPARGQDLFVLPPDGSAGRPVVLLTYSRTPGTNGTEILLTRVSDGQAKTAATASVAGWPVDSRMIGSRLFVVTQSWESSSGAWQPKVRLAEFDLSSGTIAHAKTTEVAGSSPKLSAGSDWISLATELPYVWDSWPSTWGKSEVRIFRVGPSGTELLAPSPIRTAGQIQDKFKVQVNGDICTAISMSWGPAWNLRRTVLENFRLGTGAGTTPVGSLELAKGESLFATRFDGRRVYVVTFQQVDPLWVVDLADPEKPVVAGHLEVPGWSTHLTPLGDGLVFSIGYDSGKISASLFDVSTPASPALLSRVNLGAGWAWSEATWDEKALKVIPESGLALVPVSTWKSGSVTNEMQILDIDLAERELRARGTIAHDFAPRRAAALGENIASISQRELFVVGAADRDHPSVLADVLLAWPVNRVLVAGDKLIEIEDGSGWGTSSATFRIAPAADPDAIETELPAGEGAIADAAVRGGKLFVLRSAGQNTIQPLLVSGLSMSPKAPAAGAILEIYDCSKLPALPLLGKTSLPLDAANVNGTLKMTLTFPVPSRAAILLESQSFARWGGPVLLAKPLLADVADMAFRPGPWLNRESTVGVAVVDILDPLAPIAQPVSWIGKVAAVSAPAAADGLLAFGFDAREQTPATKGLAKPNFRSRIESRLQVVEVPASGPAVLRPAVDLPGTVVGITQLDRAGALIWTQTRALANGRTSPEIQVSAYDGADAILVAGQTFAGGPVAFSERSLFAAGESGVSRFDLTDAAKFTPGPAWELGFRPSQVLARGARLLATDGTKLAVSDLDSFPASAGLWDIGLWIGDLSLLSGDKTLFAPLGAYGVDVYSLPGNLK